MIEIGIGTVMLQLAVAVWPTLSVTVPVKGNVPPTVGVPLMPPEASAVNPVGNDPVIRNDR